MKKLITLFLIVMILILPGCKRDYMFLYDTSRIIEIQIVDITGYDIVDDEMVIYSSVLLSVNNKAEFIEDKLKEEDRLIKQAVIGPSEAILKIKTLPLIEKLALWSTRKEKLDYYRKMDISDYIIVLDKIKNLRLKENVQWNLLKIPFDVSNDELMEQFLFYVDELFIAKNKVISRPTIIGGTLDELEIYYQKINMYYSFSKVFNLQVDIQWIYDERIKISDDINEILRGI